MARPRSRPLPDDDQIWALVHEFAHDRQSTGRPIWTLNKRVRNTITAVHPKRIERESEDGRSNKTPIRRGEVLKVWNALVEHGQVRKGLPNYFTLALLQAALPKYIDNVGDGSIALHDHLSTIGATREFSYSEAATLGRGSRARDSRNEFVLRESDTHWNIKHFIHSRPDEALAKLDGGPWESSALEIPLPIPTSDRIDVIVRDSSGYHVLIEVKPSVKNSSVGLYAQTAKYRAIWQVLHSLDIDEVRCALAAPQIPPALARQMKQRHRIESVAVTVPSDFIAPERDD